MPSDFECTETAMFCSTVLGAESQVLCRFTNAVTIKDDAGFVLQMAVVFDLSRMICTPWNRCLLALTICTRIVIRLVGWPKHCNLSLFLSLTYTGPTCRADMNST
jgi:hypothetical protein